MTIRRLATRPPPGNDMLCLGRTNKVDTQTDGGQLREWLYGQAKYNRIVGSAGVALLAPWLVSLAVATDWPLAHLLALVGLSVTLALGPRWGLVELDLRDHRRSRAAVPRASLAQSYKPPRDWRAIPGRSRTRSILGVVVGGLILPVVVILWWMSPVFSTLRQLPAGGGLDVVGPGLVEILPLTAAWLFGFATTLTRAFTIKGRLTELVLAEDAHEH